MKKKLLYGFLFLNIAFQAQSVTINDAWASLISATNSASVISQSVTNLNNSIQTLQSTVDTAQSNLAKIEKKIKAAKKQAEALEYQQSLLAEKSDVMKRGIIGKIINNTDMNFVVYFPDETTVSISTQSTISLNQLFSSYLLGNLVCGVIKIVPQVADKDIVAADAESQASGLTYFLQFNMQGLNQPGYSYGALDYLSITRANIDNLGNTRAQSLYLNSLVAENELWSVDIILNYVSTRSENGATFIYPRFSTLYTNEYVEDNKTIPDPSSQKTWNKTIVINQSNTDATMSYPALTGDTAKFWGDVVTA